MIFRYQMSTSLNVMQAAILGEMLNAQQEYDIHQAAILGEMLNVQQSYIANALLDSVMSPNEFKSTLN